MTRFSFASRTALFVFLGLFALAGSASAETDKTLKMLELFGDVFEKVREEYVEVPNDQELVEAAINGMLTHLDPHSSYLSKRDYEEMQVQTKGEFGGLGIEVTMENGLVKVVSPIDETPAYKAGIQAGDYVTHIDSESVIGMSLNAAVDKMRGKPGSKIVLTILRESEKEPFDVEIIRDVIKIRSVRSERYGDVAYIRVTSFSEKTGLGVEREIEKLSKEIGKSMRGVVLDLRNNPGGLLDQAIAVSDIFLDKGEIVSTRGREADSTKRYNATEGDALKGSPIIVLVNAGSASASEIVSGALQDHNRAIVMGTKSFGKGSVQTIIPLPGDGAMRLTTSRYYTPSGNSIQATGIVPDVIVEQAKLEFVSTKRRQTEASLPGHLENGKEESSDKAKDKKGSDKDTKAKEDTTKDGGKEGTKEGGEMDAALRDLYEKDYQLARAVDLLAALHIRDIGRIRN